MRNNEAAGESVLWSTSSPSITDLRVCTAVSHILPLLSAVAVVAQLSPLALLSQRWLALAPLEASHSSHPCHPHSATRFCHTNPIHTHCALSHYLEFKKCISSCLWQIFVIKFSDNSICVGATWFFGMYNPKLCIRHKFYILHLGIYRMWCLIFNIQNLTFTRFCTTSELVISKLTTAYLHLDA